MKFIATVILLVTCVSSAICQPFVRLNLGYAHSYNPEQVERVLMIDGVLSEDKISLSYGRLIAGMGLGYNVKDNFAVECIFSIRPFSSESFTFYEFEEEDIHSFAFQGPLGKMNMESEVYEIAPMISYVFSNSSWKPYIKLGVNLLKVNYKKKEDYMAPLIVGISEFVIGRYERVEQGAGDWSVGFQNAFGVMHNLSERVLITSEIGMVFYTYHFTDRSNEVRFNGDVLDTPDSWYFNDDKVDFSRISLNIGVTYYLTSD